MADTTGIEGVRWSIDACDDWVEDENPEIRELFEKELALYRERTQAAVAAGAR